MNQELKDLKERVDRAHSRYHNATAKSGEAAPVGFTLEAKRMAAYEEYRKLRDDYIKRAREAGVFEGPTPIKLREKYR